MYMTSKKKRTNLSLADDLDQALEFLAKRDSLPKATKAAELLKIAIEIEEDEVWDRLAAARDKKGAKFIDHKDAWE